MKEIYAIDNPSLNEACFIIQDGTMARFLDKNGNKTFPIRHLDRLMRTNGKFKNSIGEIKSYEFVDCEALLDASGREIAYVDKRGFIH